MTYDGFQSSGSLVAPDAPSVQTLGTWHRRVTGAAMSLVVGTSINDMRYFNFAGIPAGCYGATGGNGHAADEWLDLASLAPAAKTIGGLSPRLVRRGRLSAAWPPHTDLVRSTRRCGR